MGKFINILFDITTLYSVVSLVYAIMTAYQFIPLHFFLLANFVALWFGCLSIAITQKKMIPFYSKDHEKIMIIIKKYFFAVCIAAAVYLVVDIANFFSWQYDQKDTIMMILAKFESIGI